MRTLTEVGDDLEELGEPVLDSDLLAFWALITIIGFWGQWAHYTTILKSRGFSASVDRSAISFTRARVLGFGCVCCARSSAQGITPSFTWCRWAKRAMGHSLLQASGAYQRTSVCILLSYITATNTCINDLRSAEQMVLGRFFVRSVFKV